MSPFKWDPNKEAHNLRKHRLDFTTASLIWNGAILEKVDARRDWRNPRGRNWRSRRLSHGRRLHLARNVSSHHLSAKG